MKNYKLTIVIPVLNEEQNINIIYNEINKLNLPITYQILFIDDGSTDNSLKKITELNSKDEKVKCISFLRNFGHQNAIFAGIENSSTDYIITMDCDLQHPTKLLPKMLKEKDKFDIIQMTKNFQGKRNIFFKIFSNFFYFLINKISNIKLEKNSSDFRLLNRKVADNLKKFKERDKFIRGIIAWSGYKIKYIKYKPDQRKYGKPKYNFFKLNELAFFGLLNFSEIPLKLSFYSGIIISFFSFSYGIFAILKKIIAPQNIPIGYTDIITVLTFLGGIQLIFIGIIGMYISKIYEQLKERPIYIINKKI